MNVAQLIAELLKLPQDAEVRVVIGCAHETLRASLGEVSVRARNGEVVIDGWASNTNIDINRNDADLEQVAQVQAS